MGLARGVGKTMIAQALGPAANGDTSETTKTSVRRPPGRRATPIACMDALASA